MPAKYKYIFNQGLANELKLINEPLNWEALRLTMKRSSQYKGLFKTFTGDLSFWGDGAALIKSTKETNGIISDTTAHIYIFNFDTYLYELIYEGRVNYVNYREEWSEDGLFTVNTNLEGVGFEQTLLTGDKVPCNIYKLETRQGETMQPFTDFEGIDISVDGQKTSRFLEARTLNDFFGNFTQVIDRGSNEGIYQAWVHWSLTKVEIENSLFQDVFFYPTQVSEENTTNIRKYFFAAAEKGVYNIEWELEYSASATVQDDSGEELTQFYNLAIIEIRSASGLRRVATDLSPLPTVPSNDVTFTHSWSGSLVLELEIGDQVYFYGEMQYELNDPGGDRATFNSFQIRTLSHYINVEAVTEYVTTSIRGMMPWEASNRVVEFLTGKPLAVQSEIFSRIDQESSPSGVDGFASRVAICGGKDVRGYPFDECETTLTLSDLINAYSAMFNIGMGVEYNNGDPYAIIDDISKFYDPTTSILTLTNEIKTPVKTLLSDNFYSVIEIGYVKYKIEDRNFQSSQEMLTQRQYSTGVDVIDSTMSILSPFIAGSYGFEYMRRNTYLLNIDSNDEKRFDDDIFVLSTVRTSDIEIPTTEHTSGALIESAGGETIYTVMRIKEGEAILNENVFKEQTIIEGVNEILWASSPKDQPRAWVNTLPTGGNNTNKFLKMGGELILHSQNEDYSYSGNFTCGFNATRTLFTVDRGNIDIILRSYNEGGVNSDEIVRSWNPFVDGNDFNELDTAFSGIQTTTDTPKHFQVIIDATAYTITDDENLDIKFYFTDAATVADFSVDITYDTFADYQQERIQDYYTDSTTVEGLLNWESGLNYRMSPRQMIERHLTTLNQINNLTGQDVFRHQNTEGNNQVVIVDPDFVESGDVPTDEGSLWLNETLRFSTPWSLSEQKTVEANKYGVIAVDSNQVDFVGYVEEIVWDVEQGTAEVSLLKVAGPVPITDFIAEQEFAGDPVLLDWLSTDPSVTGFYWERQLPTDLDYVATPDANLGDVTGYSDSYNLPTVEGEIFYRVWSVRGDIRSDKAEETSVNYRP